MEVCLKRGEEQDIVSGSLWIYDNEINWYTEDCTDGCVVDVLDSRRRFVARGFFNSRSKIVVRVLTRDQNEPIDRDFFQKRIAAAWEYRKNIGLTNACRVVFGDSDGLPGLTVDKFGDYLSFQIVSLGLENWKRDIVAILAELFQPKGIYERDDLPVREKEGLPQCKGCVYGQVPDQVEIVEHDAKMLVDIPNGQKTGHFLDQQENRGVLMDYVNGKSVLDLCCCTGGFSVHAGLYGAKSVEAVDVSESALGLVRQNAQRNGVAVETTCANVFDLVHQYCDEGRQYDVVILDPPAFTKSRSSVKKAVKGYREINLRAMKLVRDGGFLATCSCSHFMDPELFSKTIREAASGAHKRLRQVEYRTQAADHPILWAADESYYLKFYIFQVCDEA